jgi:hypothetical protein
MRGERVLAILVARRWIAGESPLVMLADFAIVDDEGEPREVRD